MERTQLAAIVAAASLFICAAGSTALLARAQVPAPSPSASATPGTPSPAPTQPPIVVSPASAQVPVGGQTTVHIMSALGQLTFVISNPAVAAGSIDQGTQTLTLNGKSPGSAIVTITDQRAISAQLQVRVAYNAGSIADSATIRITGDPASPEFVKQEATATAAALLQARPGAQAIVTTDLVNYNQPLQQDDTAVVDVPVLLQGEQYFTVSGTTHVRVENVAAPAILPDSLRWLWRDY